MLYVCRAKGCCLRAGLLTLPRRACCPLPPPPSSHLPTAPQPHSPTAPPTHPPHRPSPPPRPRQQVDSRGYGMKQAQGPRSVLTADDEAGGGALMSTVAASPFGLPFHTPASPRARPALYSGGSVLSPGRRSSLHAPGIVGSPIAPGPFDAAGGVDLRPYHFGLPRWAHNPNPPTLNPKPQTPQGGGVACSLQRWSPWVGSLCRHGYARSAAATVIVLCHSPPEPRGAPCCLVCLQTSGSVVVLLLPCCLVRLPAAGCVLLLLLRPQPIHLRSPWCAPWLTTAPLPCFLPCRPACFPPAAPRLPPAPSSWTSRAARSPRAAPSLRGWSPPGSCST